MKGNALLQEMQMRNMEAISLMVQKLWKRSKLLDICWSKVADVVTKSKIGN